MKLGTSSVVVAAFVGPGTVLTCVLAGVQFGYELGWVLVFATLAVFVLQSFTAGTGILAGKGIGEAVQEVATTRFRKAWMYSLIILGLGIGCAAFESGNLAGASFGLMLLSGGDGPSPVYIVIVTVLAGLLLVLNVRVVIQVLGICVALMGGAFVVVLFVAPVNWAAAVQGLITPVISNTSSYTILALVGTTVVTYTLFLHPGASNVYWSNENPLVAWKKELTGMAIFVPLGGVVSLSILYAGASISQGDVNITDIASYAAALEPLVGPASTFIFGLGLFVAGLTSAVTAPLAASMGISGLFGKDASSALFRWIWVVVLLTGLFFNLTGISPLQIIIAAQAANGLLLPIIAGFVLYLTFKQKAVRLPRWYRVIGVMIVIVCVVLGGRTLFWVWGKLFS